MYGNRPSQSFANREEKLTVSIARVKREQLISQAEGYLDLIVSCGEIFVLDNDLQCDLAEKALECLSPLEESTGRRAHVLYLKGQAHRLCKRYDLAIEMFEAALEFDSNNVHLYLSLGWCYKRVGNLTAAITALEDALDVEPNSGIVNYNLACYWALANHPNTAVKFLSRAFDLDHRYRDLIADESDFDKIRNHPAFLAVTTVIV